MINLTTRATFLSFIGTGAMFLLINFATGLMLRVTIGWTGMTLLLTFFSGTGVMLLLNF